MKNIIEICKEFGIEIPAEKHADLLKAVNTEYRTITEHNKVLDKLTAATKRAETAEEALKGFDGIDPEKISEQLAEANRKVKEAQEAAQKQLEERDYNDALKAELDKIKFTSAAARKAVEADIRSAGLKHRDGKILGLNDLIGQLKEQDATAFVDEKAQQQEQNRPRFTTKPTAPTSGKPLTREDIMSIPDRSARRAAMAQNQHLFNNKGE